MTRDTCYLCDLASDEADCDAVIPMAQEIAVTNGRVYRGPDQEDCDVLTDNTLSSPHQPWTSDVILNVTIVTLERLGAADKAKRE